MKKSTDSQTDQSSFVILCEQSTQTDEEVVISHDEVDPLHEQEITETDSLHKDPSYVPSKSDEKPT